jgi:hypothetical protein
MWTSEREKFLDPSAPPLRSHPQHISSLGRVVPADQIVDDVGMPDALLNGLGVVEVVFLASVQQLGPSHGITGPSR